MPDETSTPVEGLGDALHDVMDAAAMGDFEGTAEVASIGASHTHVGASKVGAAFGEKVTGGHTFKPLSPVASAGSDVVKADPEKMRAAADLGDRKIAVLHEKLAALITAVKATEANGTWQGTAAVDYRDAFLNILQSFDKQLERFSAYPRELRAYADQHEGAIDEANRAAVEAVEAAEAANWNVDI